MGRGSFRWSGSAWYPYGGAEGTDERVQTILSCFFEEVHEVERVSVMRDQSTGVRTGGMRECPDHRRLVSLH